MSRNTKSYGVFLDGCCALVGVFRPSELVVDAVMLAAESCLNAAAACLRGGACWDVLASADDDAAESIVSTYVKRRPSDD